MNIRIAEEKNFSDIIYIYNHAVDEKFATVDTEMLLSNQEKSGLHITRLKLIIFTSRKKTVG